MTETYGTEQKQQPYNLFEVSYGISSLGDFSRGIISFNAATNDGAGVCVTDEHNNILIAFNDNKPATFSVKFTHDYNAIYAKINNN